MQIPDLAVIDYEHVGSLAYDSGLPEVIDKAIAVGWLGEVCPQTGTISETLITAIEYAHREHQVDSGELGYHRCEICVKEERRRDDVYEARGEFLIQWQERTYVLPRMVLHYIEEHNYLPPQTFLDDVSSWWCNRPNETEQSAHPTATRRAVDGSGWFG